MAAAYEVLNEGDHATYVYRAGGPDGVAALNRALDLLGFRVEGIYADADSAGSRYRKAAQRLPALRLLREAFVGRVVHTDGWPGYDPLGSQGYDHEVTFLKGKKKTPSELMPRVHRVISLLKRWLIGTHQGAVSLEHLDYYLDEFTFRFNRRKSRSRGELFYRLLQQAVAIDPVPYKSMVKCYATPELPYHKM